MNNNEAINTLNEIKDLMQKSSRFQTISGLSIIIIGIYASIVSLGAWLLLGNHETYSWLPTWSVDFALNTPGRTWTAILCALALVVVSFGTVCVMSYAKTKRQNHHFSFDQTVRRPLFHFFVPAVTGGLLCLAMLLQGHYGLTSSSIALLGYVELLLGIIDCFLVNHAILLWFLGFGLWHIVFGIFFTLKNRQTSCVNNAVNQTGSSDNKQ